MIIIIIIKHFIGCEELLTQLDLVYSTMDEILQKVKPWVGGGPPTLPGVQFSLLMKTNMQ
jgi:hypothetical protein